MKMKKIIVLAFLLVSATMFSQSWSNWTVWSSSDCFNLLEYRYRTKYVTTTKKYKSETEFRNRYSEKVSYNFEITGGSYIDGNNRKTNLKPTGIYKSHGFNFTSDKLSIKVTKFRFGKDVGAYANCGDSSSKTKSSNKINSKSKKQKDIKEQGSVIKENQTETEKNMKHYLTMKKHAKSYLNQANNTSNPKKKLRLLKKANKYNKYLTESERIDLKSKIFSTNLTSATSGFVDVNYGRGNRNLMLIFSTGVKFISNSVSENFETSLPLQINTEITIPVSRKLAIEIYGEYAYNYMLNDDELSGLTGVNSVSTDVEKEVNLGAYNFGLGLNIGKGRKFSVLLLNDYRLYNYKEREKGKADKDLGKNKYLATYGLGLKYNFLGKSKNELQTLSISYTYNNKDFEFLNSENGLNDINNLNIKYEMSVGALFLGFEYNLFNDKIKHFDFSTFGLSVGYKFAM